MAGAPEEGKGGEEGGEEEEETFAKEESPVCLSAVGSDQIGGKFSESGDMKGYWGGRAVSEPVARFSHVFSGRCVRRSCGRYVPTSVCDLKPLCMRLCATCV